MNKGLPRRSFLSLLAMTLTIFSLQSVFAAITITPDIAPGIYDHAIELHLTSSDPTAKIFYSFNPDGGPNDALLYTGAVTLTESTAFVYFGFVNTDDESKVLIDDYIINYPNLSFATGSLQENDVIKGLQIKNTLDTDLDISYWKIRSQNFLFNTPKDTIIKSGMSYLLPDIPLSGGQAVLLMSPDEETKDIFVSSSNQEVLKSIVPEKKKTFVRSTVHELAPEIWIKPRLAKITTIQTVHDVTPIALETPIIAPTLLPSETPKKIDDTKLADNLKIAVNESSSNNSMAPWFILALVIISGGTIGVRFLLQKKK